MKYSRYIPALSLMFLVVLTAAAAESTKDSLETVKKNLADKKAVLLDVREKGEWDAGHLADAIHLPLSTIKKGVTDEQLNKIAGKDTIIYLHCVAGVRSLDAASRLSNSGRDLRALKPGYSDLVKAGFAKANH